MQNIDKRKKIQNIDNRKKMQNTDGGLYNIALIGEAHHYPGMREVIKPREGLFEKRIKMQNFDRKCKSLMENAKLRGKTNS